MVSHGDIIIIVFICETMLFPSDNGRDRATDAVITITVFMISVLITFLIFDVTFRNGKPKLHIVA